jgi:hypothetical protein
MENNILSGATITPIADPITNNEGSGGLIGGLTQSTTTTNPSTELKTDTPPPIEKNATTTTTNEGKTGKSGDSKEGKTTEEKQEESSKQGSKITFGEIGEKNETATKENETATKTTAPAFDFKKELGEEYDSIDKIKEALQERKALQEKQTKLFDVEKLDSTTKQAIEFLKNGGDIKMFASVVVEDFDNMSDKKIARMAFDKLYGEKFATLNDEEKNLAFEHFLKTSYGNDEVDDEATYKAKQAIYKAELAQMRNYFKSVQAEALANPQKQQLEDDKKAFLDSIDQDAKSYKGLQLAFSKDEVMEFKNEKYEDLRDFYLSATPKERNHAIMLYKNFDKIIEKAQAYGMKLGKEEVMKTLKNPQTKREEYNMPASMGKKSDNPLFDSGTVFTPINR